MERYASKGDRRISRGDFFHDTPDGQPWFSQLNEQPAPKRGFGAVQTDTVTHAQLVRAPDSCIEGLREGERKPRKEKKKKIGMKDR